MKRSSLAGFTVAAVIGLVYTAVYTTVGETSSDISEYIAANAVSAVEDTYSSYETDLFIPQSETTKSTTARTDIPTKTENNAVSAIPDAQAGTKPNVVSQAVAYTVETTTTPKATTTVPATTTTPKATTTVPVTTTTPKATTTVPVTTTTPKATTTVPVTTTTPKATTTVPVTTTTPKATTTVPVTEPREFGTTPATTTAVTTPAETTDSETHAPSDAGTLTYKLNGKTYTDSAYNVVCRVVEREMGSSFHEEALKAQAVATYSFIKYKNDRGIAPELLMRDTASTKVKNAVADVIGEGVYYNGSLCEAVYSASQGGASASASEVWGGYVPYLVSVENDYDSFDSANYGKNVTFTESQMRAYLESYTGLSLSSDPENWIEIDSRYDSGYVKNVIIDGRKTVSGRQMREKVLDFDIHSSNFDVEYKNGEFIFTTYGYGHGVGLSQVGANLYATKGGYDYVEILEHYYHGATVR